MVVLNGPISCLTPVTPVHSTPFTMWSSNVPPLACPFITPLSPTCSSTTPLPTLPIASPLSPTFPTLSPINTLNSTVVITPTSWKQSYGMEQVWLAEFHRLFSSFYQQVWILQPVDHKPVGNNSMHTFVDSAKVRFCCDNCGHGWTSMKGRVVFWFDLLSPYYSNGFVAFKLYGQQCDRCKTNAYEQAMWYPEEVSKVLTNLYNKVGQIFYGFYQPPIEKTRRSGKPRTPHNSDLCQACKDGLCADRK